MMELVSCLLLLDVGFQFLYKMYNLFDEFPKMILFMLQNGHWLLGLIIT